MGSLSARDACLGRGLAGLRSVLKVGDVRFSLLDNLVDEVARVISAGILDCKTGLLAAGKEVARLLVVVVVWVVGVVVVTVLGRVVGDGA